MFNHLISLAMSSGYLLLKGLGMTIFLWLCSALVGFSIGIPLGIINSERLKSPVIASLISKYVFLVRSIPLYIHLLIAYFVLPDLLHISLSSGCAAVLALGICSSGYVAEIIRSGINAVPSGQWHACYVLGYSRWQSLRYAILPQVFYTVLPSLFNELESLIKSTSIFSAIGVVELTKVGINIVARTMDPIPVYILLACLYIVLSAFLRCIGNYIERKIAYARY